jgi:hypothetical protein
VAEVSDGARGSDEELPVAPPGLHFESRRSAGPKPAASAGPAPRSEVEAYVDHLLGELAAKQGYADSLEAEVSRRNAEAAALRARAGAAEAELEALRRAHADAAARLGMTRYRIADVADAQLRRVPLLHRALRRAVAAVRARRHAA